MYECCKRFLQEEFFSRRILLVARTRKCQPKVPSHLSSDSRAVSGFSLKNERRFALGKANVLRWLTAVCVTREKKLWEKRFKNPISELSNFMHFSKAHETECSLITKQCISLSADSTSLQKRKTPEVVDWVQAEFCHMKKLEWKLTSSCA